MYKNQMKTYSALYLDQSMAFAGKELLQYTEGNYYFKELDSGIKHDLNPNKYPFSINAEDNDALKEITIYEPPVEVISDIPTLNELHFMNSVKHMSHYVQWQI